MHLKYMHKSNATQRFSSICADVIVYVKLTFVKSKRKKWALCFSYGIARLMQRQQHWEWSQTSDSNANNKDRFVQILNGRVNNRLITVDLLSCAHFQHQQQQQISPSTLWDRNGSIAETPRF